MSTRNYNRAVKACEVCEASFSVPHYRSETARFCSAACKGKSVAARHLNTGPKPWAAANLDGHRHKSPTRFKPCHRVWNKDLKGIHLSPASEFVKGCEALNRQPVGTVTERTRSREGRPRAWVKVAEPMGWKLRAHVVWEANNGPIPRGMVIHHKDRDQLNDDIGNLQMMTPAEHIEEHRDEHLQAKVVRRFPRVKPGAPKQETLL